MREMGDLLEETELARVGLMLQTVSSFLRKISSKNELSTGLSSYTIILV